MNSQKGMNGCLACSVVRSEPAISGRLRSSSSPTLPMKTTLFALLCALVVLPLAACGGDDAADTADTTVTTDDSAMDDAADDTMMDDADSAGDVAAAVDLPGTIAAAGDDITAIEPGAALANINGWINTLDGAEFTNATEIRDGLISATIETEHLDATSVATRYQQLVS